MRLALDATYSIGPELSGVGVYSRQLIASLIAARPGTAVTLCYRAHRLRAGLGDPLAASCSRTLLTGFGPLARFDVFHGLNQRMPERRLRHAVSTFHDLFVLTAEYSTPEFRARFAAQARHAAASSDLIIAVSAFTAKQVQDLLGVAASRVRVVHHGVTPPPPAFVRVPEPIILHVGAIQKRKNLARLIEAFEQTPSEWQLVLAGSTAGYGAAEILGRIDRSPRRQGIVVTGYVGSAQLEEWYSRASVFAFPSLDEGFGMPILDAMARGVPVVTSATSALGEVAGDAAILVDPRDGDALAASLRLLCEDAALREAYSRKGQMHAAGFTWAAAAESTWRVYDDLVR